MKKPLDSELKEPERTGKFPAFRVWRATNKHPFHGSVVMFSDEQTCAVLHNANPDVPEDELSGNILKHADFANPCWQPISGRLIIDMP